MSEDVVKGEIRKDYITGSRVIFAFSRDKRQRDFKNEEVTSNAKDCPFEYGKENLNKTIKLVGNPWKLRLIYNKYPIVNEEIIHYKNSNFLRRYSNYGHSYVIIDTPNHLQKFHEIEENILQKWFNLIIDTENTTYSDKRIKQVCTFKDSGSISGGSLYHQHTQIIGFTFISPIIKKEINVIKNNHRKCILEEALKKEKERVLIENKNAIAFAPYGSRFRGHSIIMPKRHIDYVGRLDRAEIKSLVKFIKTILAKNDKIFDKHSYNLIFHELKGSKELHFYIEITPRFSNIGSAELSGLYINSLTPEEYTKIFNETD